MNHVDLCSRLSAERTAPVLIWEVSDRKSLELFFSAPKFTKCMLLGAELLGDFY
jgi:hypothetical protein